MGEEESKLHGILEEILKELRKRNRRSNIETYILDWIDKKYTGRVISKINTEWETMLNDGREPGKSEYEHMVQRAMQIHREENIKEQ